MRKAALAILSGAVLLLAPVSRAAAPARVMILDGESGGTYHNWQLITPVLKKELDDTGLFQTDVVTAPNHTAGYAGFHPDWSKYKVIVFNYDAPDMWPSELKTSLETYMKDGGGLVTI